MHHSSQCLRLCSRLVPAQPPILPLQPTVPPYHPKHFPSRPTSIDKLRIRRQTQDIPYMFLMLRTSVRKKSRSRTWIHCYQKREECTRKPRAAEMLYVNAVISHILDYTVLYFFLDFIRKSSHNRHEKTLKRCTHETDRPILHRPNHLRSTGNKRIEC